MKDSDTDSAILTSSASSLGQDSNNDNEERSGAGTIASQNRTKNLADERLAEVTINKLKIQSIGMVGREKESELLHERLRNLVQHQADAVSDNESISYSSVTSVESNDDRDLIQVSKTNKELILIKGFSGVGKTSLARAIKQDVNSNGFFVEGKFALNVNKDEPYSGIAKAYSELIRELKRTDGDLLHAICQRLCDMLGSEVEPLTYLIPELDEVVLDYSTSSTSYSVSSNHMEGMQEKWKYSFRVLTRLLTAHVKPLVIVIDDLQWADKASLDLIECLITDAQNVNSLMLMGLYRSNEVDESSDLSTLVRSLKQNENKYGVNITEIELEGFGTTEVNRMIMRMMDSEDEERTMELAELCFQRTLGNPFFVIEFMSMLHRQELIQLNIGTMKWMYDVIEIDYETLSTANVVELLQSRMREMPTDVQLLVSIAACLGPSFRVSILNIVWRNLAYVESKGFHDVKVSKLMNFIQKEMLIEPGAGDTFQWVHDKVQEAALSFAEVEKDTLRFEMGKVLYLNLMGKALNDELFDVADLISSARDKTSADFASLCLKAARKARRMSAFSSAARYIESGIEMLPNDSWSTHQSLTLDLHRLGAQVKLALGNVPETKRYCSAALMRTDVDMDSKIPFRVVEFKRLAQVELDHPNAIKAALALLKDMGFKFRWNRTLVAVQAVSLLRKSIKDVKEQPTDFYRRLDRMDVNNRKITEILNSLMQEYIATQAIMHVVLCSCHIVQLTLKHGLSEYSATHFGTLGSVAVLVFQMHKDAPIFREVALSTQNHYGRGKVAHTYHTIYGHSLAWTVRNDALTQLFYNAYIQGMQNGEVNVAMWLLLSHCITIPFYTGKQIGQILEALPAATLQMDEVSQNMQAHLVKCFWQMFLILQDPTRFENPCVLKGEVHSIEDCDEDPMITTYHDFAEFQLLLFFDHESAADRAISDAGKYEKATAGYIGGMIETFHRGISLYVAARRTKHRKYKRHAKKIRNTIHKWKKQGNPNVVYYCIFLDAEQAALEGKLDEAETLYKKAIQFVAKSGYLHHAGLFNERYSDFLLVERNDPEEAKYRLEEAIRYYGDWGAHGVVDRLNKATLLQ